MTARRVALAGNPNVGKTSLFNELTGSRHKVGNYAGVTVETREGHVDARLEPACPLVLVDLPGTYSLTPISEDEAVAFRCLAGEGDAPPDVVVLVLDAANLARNLYLAVQLLELGRPLVVALNMIDVAAAAGAPVDPAALSRALGVGEAWRSVTTRLARQRRFPTRGGVFYWTEDEGPGTNKRHLLRRWSLVLRPPSVSTHKETTHMGLA